VDQRPQGKVGCEGDRVREGVTAGKRSIIQDTLILRARGGLRTLKPGLL